MHEAPAPVDQGLETGSRPSLSQYLRDLGLAEVEQWMEFPLVAGIADGTLAPEIFRHYLEQDYLYLRNYVRLYAKLAAHAPDAEVEHLVRLAWNVLDVELGLHRGLGEAFGCDFERASPSAVCTEYIDFLLDAAASFGDGLVASLPCIWGYGMIASRMRPPTDERYRRWVATYDSARFEGLLEKHCQLLDDAAPDPARAEALFRRGLALEAEFWNQEP